MLPFCGKSKTPPPFISPFGRSNLRGGFFVTASHPLTSKRGGRDFSHASMQCVFRCATLEVLHAQPRSNSAPGTLIGVRGGLGLAIPKPSVSFSQLSFGGFTGTWRTSVTLQGPLCAELLSPKRWSPATPQASPPGTMKASRCPLGW